MKILVLVIALCASVSAEYYTENLFSTEVRWCRVYENVVDDYRHAIYQFTIDAYKVAGSRPGNFVLSPLSVWIILAAIAEAADHNTKLVMFQYLRLPLDPCIRLKYYELATSRNAISNDVYIANTRTLVIDEGLTVNPAYYNFVNKYSLFDIVSAPIRYNPQVALAEIKRVINARLSDIDLSGNSIILDAVDYNALWTTAFENAIVERCPFYSRSGQLIGTVDMIKIRKRVRRTYLQSINLNVIEIPVGYNGRYRIAIGIVLDNNIARAIRDLRETVIDEYLDSLEESTIPIDIAIPRLSITSEFDLKKTLEELGLITLLQDPTVTRLISAPAALPSGFVHRATITLNNAGLEPTPYTHQSSYNTSANWDPVLGREFIANRPFLFALFDAETYTCMWAAAFSEPTYRN